MCGPGVDYDEPETNDSTRAIGRHYNLRLEQVEDTGQATTFHCVFIVFYVHSSGVSFWFPPHFQNILSRTGEWQHIREGFLRHAFIPTLLEP